MSRDKITNILTATVALLTGAIAIGAFIISYDALYATGLEHGIPKSKAWLWPLLIDAPLIVFTLALLVAQILRAGVKLWAGLVLTYTVATIAFNLAHAQLSALGWLVAVVAPVSLLLTTEALRHLARGLIERQAVVESLAELSTRRDKLMLEVDALAVNLDDKSQDFEELTAAIYRLQLDVKVSNIERDSSKLDTLNLARQVKRQERLDTLRYYLLNNPGASLTQAAKVIGISRQTLGGYVKELGLSKNGNGWSNEDTNLHS